MIKTYRCKETFLIDDYDGDGFYLDTASWIEEGTIFECDTEYKRRIAGGDDTIRMENDSKWLELTKDNVEKYFDEVSGNDS